MGFFIIIFINYTALGLSKNIEQKLIDHLFTNNDVNARPVLDPKTSVNVTFGIELINLIKVNDRDQFLTTKIWFWYNQLLIWDPNKWGGLESIEVEGSVP